MFTPASSGTENENSILIEEAPLLPTSQVSPKCRRKKNENTTLKKTILYFMAIHFCIAFTDIITTAPLIKLFEGVICGRVYAGDERLRGGFGNVMGLPVDRCKSIEVQKELARVRGVKGGLDMVPVLLVAIPLGKLGARVGRRKIMGLSIIGVIASLIEVFVVCAFPKIFPLKLVWLSSILLLCGGGLNTATAFMYSMASEAIPSENRSQGYYYIFSAFYIAELISSFTAGMTIDISPWIPCGLALASMFICLSLLIFMPPPSVQNAERVTTTSIIPESEAEEQTETQSLLKPSPDPKPTTPPKSLTTIILHNRNITLTIPIFLVGVYRYTTLNILIQYASVRFGLKISNGALFYTEAAVANIGLFLFVLPWVVAQVKRRWGGDGGERGRDSKKIGERIDLGIMRISLGFLCVGSALVGLAPTERFLPFGVLIFALGFGSSVSALSLISYWVNDAEKGTVYAAVVVLQSLGHVVGDPVLMGIYAWGLGDDHGMKTVLSTRSLPVDSDGKAWQAAPFFVISGLYASALLSASFIRLDRVHPSSNETFLPSIISVEDEHVI